MSANPVTEDQLHSVLKTSLENQRDRQDTTLDSRVVTAILTELLNLRELAASTYVFMARHHANEAQWLDMLLAAAQGGAFDATTIPQLVETTNDWFRQVDHPVAGAVLVQRGRDGDDPAVILCIQLHGKIGTMAMAYESNLVRDTAFTEMSDELIYNCVEKLLPPLINHIPNT